MMEITNKNKILFLIAFFGLNILCTILLTTNLILENLSPFPRTMFMVINSFFGDIGFLLLFVGLSVFLFKRDYTRAKFLMYVSISLTLIYFALSVYFQHYNMFFSFYNLSAFKSEAGKDAAGFIIDSLLMLLTSAKFIFLIFAVIIVFLFLRLFKKYRDNEAFYNSTLVDGKNRVIIGFGIIIIGMLIMASGLSAYRVEIEDTWYEDNSTPLYGAQAVGLFNYYIYEGYSYLTGQFDGVNPNKYKTVEEKLKEYKEDKNISPIDGIEYDISRYEGVFKDKNLLLIQMESFNNFLIGLEIMIDGEYVEITPNLNRIATNSIYFNNFYNSVGIGNTSDSEFTVLTGLYPIGNDYIIYDHDEVIYPTLPRLFKDKGYYTFSSHANTGKFYERKRVHTEVYGFDQHYGKEDLVVESEKLIHSWLNDYDFLMQNLDIFASEAEKGNVFSQLITITAHMPYSKPGEALGDNWFFDKPNLFPANTILVDNPFLNMQIVGYLEHIAFVDYAIGKALERLEELGLHEDTVVILYGDHGCDIDAFELFYQKPELLKNDINEMITYVFNLENRVMQNRLFNANIPLMIYDAASDPKVEAEIITFARGTNTLARTISYLFDLDPEYFFGVNALSDAPTYSYNPRNLDIYADGVIISGQSQTYFIYDDKYLDYYDDDKIIEIIETFRKYKDFNDKLIKYKVFPPLK